MEINYIIDEFERYLRVTTNKSGNHYSESTIESYIIAVKKAFDGKDLDTITKRDLEDIQLGFIKKYKLGGNRMRYAAINLFCQAILNKGKYELYIKIPKSKPENIDVLTDEQIQSIFDVAKQKSKAILAMLLTLYDCALRRSELCHLDLEDVKFQTKELFLRKTKTGNGIVFMPSRTAEAIEDYILHERKPLYENERALFVNKNGIRIGEHFVRYMVKKIAIEAGITSRVYPHIFRASNITHLMNHKVNLLAVQKHARHSDFRTTMVYNRPTQQQMRDEIEKALLTNTSSPQNLTPITLNHIDDTQRQKALVDKFIQGELSRDDLNLYLNVIGSPYTKTIKTTN
jgi:integrase/recombinase XerD